MEVVLFGLFAVALLLSALLPRRRAGKIEPFLLVVGAAVLLTLAWGSGVQDARGAQILVTVGALTGLYRAGSILWKRRRAEI